MSRLRMGKKVWKSFSNTLQSKVQTLMAIFHSLQHLVHSKRRRRCRGSLTTRAPYAASNCHVECHAKKNISNICLDDLLYEPAASSSMHVGHAREEDTSSDITIDTIDDAWEIVVAKTLEMQLDELQVDERAEEFISKFRQQLRLQKERSLVDERAEEFISKFRQQLRLQNEGPLVDERAEEFISKFRQHLRLQKEKSLVDDRAEEFVPKFPQQPRLQNERSPVDERAEKFISKFRQQLRLQNERSLVEFQEMLS